MLTDVHGTKNSTVQQLHPDSLIAKEEMGVRADAGVELVVMARVTM
jgi:hypothetical protein